MTVTEATKYLPEGRTHFLNDPNTEDGLVLVLNSLIICENPIWKIGGWNSPEEKEAYRLLAPKDAAFYAIKRLLDGRKAPPTVIGTEADWIRYFHLKSRDCFSEH